MRLDLYLKVSRLIPRRSVAQKFCDAGMIAVNGTVAKASKDVKAGDEIELKRRGRSTRIRVTETPQTRNVSKSSAGALYELLEEVRVEDDAGLI